MASPRRKSNGFALPRNRIGSELGSMSRLSGEYRLTSVDNDHVKTISYFHESFSISRLVRVNFESATSRRADNENPEFDAVGVSAVAVWVGVMCPTIAYYRTAALAGTGALHGLQVIVAMISGSRDVPTSPTNVRNWRDSDLP
jgi:hypothetical protein